MYALCKNCYADISECIDMKDETPNESICITCENFICYHRCGNIHHDNCMIWLAGFCDKIGDKGVYERKIIRHGN
jgi:hypothetical protein